jgi:hypothetical protein
VGCGKGGYAGCGGYCCGKGWDGIWGDHWAKRTPAGNINDSNKDRIMTAPNFFLLFISSSSFRVYG